MAPWRHASLTDVSKRPVIRLRRKGKVEAMIIIGEKINGAIPSTAQAIKDRDADFIRDLAVRQAAAGADYIDVCAGTAPSEEYDALCWLLDVVEECTDKPICLDSPDPHMLVKVADKVKRPGILNSLSDEGEKCDVIIPYLAAHPEWSVMVLCSSDSGPSETCERKMEVAHDIMAKLEAAGIAQERVFIDPVVLAVSAVGGAGSEFIAAVAQLKEAWPDAKVAAAVSNVSYGSPVRGLMNHVFLVLNLQMGLDAGIIDPLNRDIIGSIYATEALLNRDPYCRKYNKAYRKGLIGKPKGI